MYQIDWITYVMIILASYRLTHLIVFDKITEFIRRPFLRKEKQVDEDGHTRTKNVPTSKFGYLVNCYWCAGIWSAVIIAICYIYIPTVAWPFIFILSIAGAQAIIETFVGIGTKVTKWFSEHE
ncbi:DUF1360 domain-containing protein [Gracilibacillus sp. S3-1-1]|uniref:DUF1360 domain-containing protein n=1 Tax=Gracilibacillus pellucidus TaxID=3095368 RepID=A0ACC6M5D7_9BACI|nr:DUF1360 domain-containing protein [Gracilibacillus sp. S3-1-1]MDX8046159.1 DUF1360 domain-containing protein [Gracilibacillus sp. S3-1-1]